MQAEIEQLFDHKPASYADADFHLEIMNADGSNRRRIALADATVEWLGHAEWR